MGYEVAVERRRTALVGADDEERRAHAWHAHADTVTTEPIGKVTCIGKCAGRTARSLLVTVLLAAKLAACSSGGGSGPLCTGVELPLTGPAAVAWQRPLKWARDNINAAGGVRGRRIELVYRDIG